MTIQFYFQHRKYAYAELQSGVGLRRDEVYALILYAMNQSDTALCLLHRKAIDRLSISDK